MGKNRNVITKLLAIRKRANISPTSNWSPVQGKRGLYAAYIGDKLAMKIGSDAWDPNDGLPTVEWQLSASGDVHDKTPLAPVDTRIVPPHQTLLLDERFECEGHDGHMIKARITAYCSARPNAGPTNVTIRAFAADTNWPWPASNDTNRYKVRDGLVMHWAAAWGSSADWARPSDEMIPSHHESWRLDEAVQTVFSQAQSAVVESDGWEDLQVFVKEVRLIVPAGVRALNFVMKHPARAHDGEDKWFKADGDFHRPPSDFHIRLPKPGAGSKFWSIWERLDESAQVAPVVL